MSEAKNTNPSTHLAVSTVGRLQPQGSEWLSTSQRVLQLLTFAVYTQLAPYRSIPLSKITLASISLGIYTI